MKKKEGGSPLLFALMSSRIYSAISCLSVKGFSQKYNLCKSVYYSEFENVEDAIQNEKRIKKYKREWKWNLINSMNPKHQDLYDTLL